MGFQRDDPDKLLTPTPRLTTPRGPGWYPGQLVDTLDKLFVLVVTRRGSLGSCRGCSDSSVGGRAGSAAAALCGEVRPKTCTMATAVPGLYPTQLMDNLDKLFVLVIMRWGPLGSSCGCSDSTDVGNVGMRLLGLSSVFALHGAPPNVHKAGS